MANLSSPSPKITHLSWGQIQVEGHPSFKDAKLFPGGARAWDWNETGTRHIPGIQPADVEELLGHGAEVIVLSRGINERLQVPEDTITYLKTRGVVVHVMQTEIAVRKYNELRKNQRVGGLFHSTC